MKLDISGIKKTHAFLLPKNEPSIPQNEQRRAHSQALLVAYENKAKEQTRFELNLGASTGRLADVLKPRVMAPTLPGPDGMGSFPDRKYVLEQANMYAGRNWPTQTPWGESFRSGMSSTSMMDVRKYQDIFAHLGMLPDTYGATWDQISMLDNYILDNNKPLTKLFTSASKMAEKVITVNYAIDEARTSYSYHFNKMNDDLRVYLHMDFVYVDHTSQEDKVRFTFPENEEQKAIWRNVFWGEPLPSFPIVPEAFVTPRTPLLKSDSTSSSSSRGSSGAVSLNKQSQNGDALVDELRRLQINNDTDLAKGAAKKNSPSPFFV